MLPGRDWRKPIVWSVNFSGGTKGFVIKLLVKLKFGITSLSRKKTTPTKLQEVCRAHWGIETGSHYRRDVTLKEDATGFVIGNGARVMANINNLILALIRQAGFLNASQGRRFLPLIFPRLLPSWLPPFPDFATAMPTVFGYID